jgi:hypothetical protein
VTWRAADLFAPPPDWRGAFDLVHELYTLLVISRARDSGESVAGPPWPLTRAQIEALAVDGLRLETLEDIPANEGLVRHWRALFRREGDT